MKRAVLVCVVSLLVVGFLSMVAGAEDLPMLKVGHVGHDHQIALYVAAEAGKSLEKDYGVYLKELKPQEVYDLYDHGRAVARVVMVKVGGGSKMPAALEQGHIEVGLGGLGPTAKFIDKGAPLKVLAPLNNDGDALVVKKDFPAESWEEFIRFIKNSKKPIRIGYKAPMAVAYMILKRALDEEGIRYGQEPMGPDGRPVQVITVNLQGLKNALPSLSSGVVDAVVVNEPMVSILVHKGVGKRVADLAELPPKGKWRGHPCCVVAAREDAIKKKGGIIKSLLKVIAAGADLMKRNIQKAFEAEAKWTKTPPAIGKRSILNVAYVIKPDDKWLQGVDTWIGLMKSSGHFKKNLKFKTVPEIRDTIVYLEPMKKALSEMTLYSEASK
jgi:NitT/TauT family transport system substrate-binding protein